MTRSSPEPLKSLAANAWTHRRGESADRAPLAFEFALGYNGRHAGKVVTAVDPQGYIAGNWKVVK